ncbi:MAG: 4Fe-4S dicluster domain-containing protein [Actinobacteria bacterium]|nr:4Fe-4S dicluster domain-containing protein [Actinomycetota bacterium]
MVVDELFDLVSYRIYPEPHIRLNPDVCQSCTHRVCTFACPARCYIWSEERDRVEFAYEACLECGTCLLLCDRGALDWHYPLGGYGVRFRLT